jgi:hypothetical protein
MSSKPPSPQETEHRKKEGKKKEKEKRKESSKSLLKEKGSQYFERRKTLQLQRSFLCDSIFSPFIIPFQKPYPISLRKFS